MKTRVFIGLLVVTGLCVALVWGQSSTAEKSCCPSSGQKVAATCPSTAAAKLASADGKATACSASKTQATACSSTATAKLASLTDKPSACCASKTQATASLASLTAKPASACASTAQASACPSTAAAKLASAKPGCPLEAAGIQLCEQQQAKVMAILTQARKDLLAVLNSEQKAKFAKHAKLSELSLMPAVFAQPASLTTSAAGCSQSCSSATTVAQTSTSASGEKACCGSCGAKTTTVAEAEQTTCPIMKSPIKKSVFTVYQGKKVYFCCPGCEKTFNKDPEKYAKNLP